MMEDKLTFAVLGCLAFGVLTAWVGEPWPAYILYAMAFGTGGAWLLGRLFRPKPIHINHLVWNLGLLAAWGMAQLALELTVNRWQTMNAVLLWAANTVLFFLSTQLFADTGRRERFFAWLLGLGLIVAVTAMFQLYTADGKIFWHFSTPYSGFVMGPFPYHNHFSAFVALILPIALSISMRDRARLLWSSLLVGAFTAAVIASASRSGAALIALEIIAGLAIGVKRSAGPIRQRSLQVLLLVCVIATSGTIAGWAALWERFHTGDRSRLKLAESSLEMIQSAPWIGSGLGTWPSAYPKHAHFDDGLFANQAHSDWLQWAAEGGVPFALCLLYFGLVISIPAIRSVWAIGIPVTLLDCLIDYPLQKPVISALFFVIAGALAAQRFSKAEKPTDTVIG